MSELTERICYMCGGPAAGYASIWTAADGERWYCHGDDDDVSCYERTQMSDAKTLPEIVARLLDPTTTPPPNLSTTEGEMAWHLVANVADASTLCCRRAVVDLPWRDSLTEDADRCTCPALTHD